jgi:hypothetical protein
MGDLIFAQAVHGRSVLSAHGAPIFRRPTLRSPREVDSQRIDLGQDLQKLPKLPHPHARRAREGVTSVSVL